jgi:hypothetical protein
METLGRKIVVILLLALAAGPIYAQKTNATYRNGELATVATMSVVVDRFGISPQEFTRPVGAFLLVIRNRFGDHTEHFSLTLDSPKAPEIYSLDTTAEKFSGAILVDLKPGKYRLRLTKWPELSVAIAIE